MLAASGGYAAAQRLQLEVVDDHVFPTESFWSGPAFGAFVVYKDELYFTASTGEDPERGSTYGLFKTDGVTLTSFPVDPEFHIGTQFVEFQDSLYFRGDVGNGVELIRTDGVALEAFDLTELVGGSAPRNFEVVGDRLYFDANPTVYGQANLMMLREGKVSIVSDVNVDSSYPWHIAVGNDLYFTANGPLGYELYRHDGRSTELVFDANPGPGSSDPWPRAVWKNELVFTAIDPAGRGLYITDGESARQLPFPSDADNYSGPKNFLAFGDHLYFTAEGENGYELFRTDGQEVHDYDFYPGAGSSYPQTYSGDAIEGRLLVTGVGPDGPAIYVISPDGQLTNAFDLGLGSDAYVSAYFREFNGEAYFQAGLIETNGVLESRRTQLFKTDGNYVASIDIALGDSEDIYLALELAVEHNGVLYLTASSRRGGELVAIDGDGASVVDVFPGLGSGPRELHSLGDHLVFVARSASGDALYQIDESGISLLGSASPNTYIESYGVLQEGNAVTAFAELGDQLLFLANTPDGFKLHRIIMVPEPTALALGAAASLFAMCRGRKR